MACKRCGVKDTHNRRYYCPGCGEVRCGHKRHGQWQVFPHFSHRTVTPKPCTGGPVDEIADRAP